MAERLTRQERDFEEASRCLDVEVMALELEYSETLRKGLLEALDRRQAAFDALLAAHPKTLAERDRIQRNRAEYQARKDRLSVKAAARRLARLWHVPLVG